MEFIVFSSDVLQILKRKHWVNEETQWHVRYMRAEVIEIDLDK